jgi:membrane protein YdbS with pleckstrin-like domain
MHYEASYLHATAWALVCGKAQVLAVTGSPAAAVVGLRTQRPPPLLLLLLVVAAVVWCVVHRQHQLWHGVLLAVACCAAVADLAADQQRSQRLGLTHGAIRTAHECRHIQTGA